MSNPTIKTAIDALVARIQSYDAPWASDAEKYSLYYNAIESALVEIHTQGWNEFKKAALHEINIRYKKAGATIDGDTIYEAIDTLTLPKEKEEEMSDDKKEEPQVGEATKEPAEADEAFEIIKAYSRRIAAFVELQKKPVVL